MGSCPLICTESEGCCVCTFARQECWVLSKSKLLSQDAPQLASVDPLRGREDCHFVPQAQQQAELLVGELYVHLGGLVRHVGFSSCAAKAWSS